jgi:hypothetical protein
MRIFPSLLFLITLLIGWTACSKEDVDIPKSFPVQFKAERWEQTAPLRLFTNGREITDRRIIEQYLGRHRYLDTLSYKLDSIPGALLIHFLSENNAVFDHQFTPSEQVFDLQRKGNRFIFKATKTTSLPQPVLRPFFAPSLEWLMMKEVDTLQSFDNTTNYQVHWTRIAHGNFKVLKVPVFGFSIQLGSDNSSDVPIEHHGLLFNEFNTEFPKLLGKTDTLLIHEFAVIFTRSDL